MAEGATVSTHFPLIHGSGLQYLSGQYAGWHLNTSSESCSPSSTSH